MCQFCDNNRLSALLGLIPDDHESKFFESMTTKVETPSTLELRLAEHEHRWPKMRKLQRQFFSDVAQATLEVETDALRLFGLPTPEEIERSEEPGFEDPGGTIPRLTSAKRNGYVRIIGELQKTLVGTEKLLKKVDITKLSLFDYYLLDAFSMGLEQTIQDILKNLPEGLDEQVVRNTILMPQLENYYLASMLKDGTKRIKTYLATTYRDRVLDALTKMIRDGKSPYDAGRYLRKEIGTGKLWYWNRITRSESVLAINAAFNAQSEAAGINYEVWSAASTACPICQGFNGHIWRRAEGPQPVSDTHPHCTLWNTKVYTSKGWQFIKNINVGDLVLTHQGRLRKVTFKHQHLERQQAMVRVAYCNEVYMNGRGGSLVSIDFTANHPMLVNGEWQDAGSISAGDRIRLLASRCEACDKLIPFSRWRTKGGERARFCSQHCNTSYTVQVYGGKYLTKEATQSCKKLFQQQQHPFQVRDDIHSLANASNARIKYNTTVEQALAEALKQAQIEFEHQYMIKRPEMRRCGSKGWMHRFYKTDFAIPGLKLVIECLGEKWHRERDRAYLTQRRRFIESRGYSVLEFNADEILNETDNCVEEIKRVMANHKGEYEFLDVAVSKVEHYQKKTVRLYNLSVADDESYVAKGFVVHNCLCTRFGHYTSGGRRVQPAWERRTPYEQPYTRDELSNFGAFFV